MRKKRERIIRINLKALEETSIYWRTNECYLILRFFSSFCLHRAFGFPLLCYLFQVSFDAGFSAFLARLHEVQKSYCSHPGRTCSRYRYRSRSRHTLLARLHEVQKSYCSHPGRTRSRYRSRSRSTLLKFSRSLYLGNHSTESIHTWTIITQ